jgi:ATP synthase protein I
MDPSDARGIGKYLNLALLLPISTFVGYLMGYGLDKLFHTTWIRYIFLLLGSVAGFIELIRELNKDTAGTK